MFINRFTSIFICCMPKPKGANFEILRLIEICHLKNKHPISLHYVKKVRTYWPLETSLKELQTPDNHIIGSCIYIHLFLLSTPGGDYTGVRCSL